MDEELSIMQKEMDKIHLELEAVHTADAASETSRQEEISSVIFSHQQEISNLLLQDAEETIDANTSYYSGSNRPVSFQENHKEGIHELSAIKTSLPNYTKHVDAISSLNTIRERGILEENMTETQEEAQTLKLVVAPLKSEIRSLKAKLVDTETRLAEALKTNCSLQDNPVSERNHLMGRQSPSLPDLESITDLTGKVEKLFGYLKAEKAARKDLEMYVAVLNTQKSMSQQETYKINSEFQNVCHLLDEEKQSHEALKQTWERANDQFLESQRLMMMDLRRMEGVLTTEQQRQITDLKRKATNDVPVKIFLNVTQNNEGKSLPIRRQASMPEFTDVTKLQQKYDPREARKVKELDEKKKKLEQEEKWKLRQTRIRKDGSRSREQSPAYGSPTSKAVNQTSVSIPIINDGTRSKKLSSSSGKVYSSTSSSEIGEDVTFEECNDDMIFLNFSAHETPLLEEVNESIESTTVIRISPEKVLNLPPLTAAQVKAITDPTPETEAYKSMVAEVKSKFGTSKLNLEGKRLVSEEEWTLLEEEMRASREKLGQPCSMCSNYETQLQTVQEDLKSTEMEMKQLERSLNTEKQTSKNLLKCQEELQLALKNSAEDVQAQIIHLTSGLQNCEKFVHDFKDEMSTTHLQLQNHCKTLAENREEVHHELISLQEENDTLVGKYSRTVQQLQSQDITLPSNLEEMKLLLEKYRRETILAKVAKEHIEQTLKDEIVLLKSQVVGEHQEKLTQEETMTKEITSLEVKVAELHTLQEELKQEATFRLQAESKLRETESLLKSIQGKSKQAIVIMQDRLEDLDKRKSKLESDNRTLKGKVQSLQLDLSNSEAVQRDFVKLSQSLQIQLEKIRQAENEVRWQHEDDVDECSNCKLLFTVTRRKHHCRHCGQVFCADCTTKFVNSGPNHRVAKVCDVCHTILVNDAAPYFGTEAPST